MLGDEHRRAGAGRQPRRARHATRSTYLGEHGRGVPVWINREWVEADLRITTGFVEPHFFAGFSGGPKLVTPGLAGLDTVLVLHDAARIGDPQRDLGRDRGQPRPRRHPRGRGRRAAALRVRRDPQPRAARDRGLRRRARADARAPPARPRASSRCGRCPEPFDVVVTSNSGYPLDQNLYQAVKGMSAAAKVVKPGGLIVCAAECRDGFPGHGSYRAAARAPARRRATSCARSSSPTTSRPTSGRSRSRPTSRTTRASSCTPSTCPTTSCASVHLEQTRDITRDRRGRGRRAPRSASCPRARRRSRTWRDRTGPDRRRQPGRADDRDAARLAGRALARRRAPSPARRSTRARGTSSSARRRCCARSGLEDEVRVASPATYHPTGGIIAVESLAGERARHLRERAQRGRRGFQPDACGCSSTRTCSSRSCVAKRWSSARRCATASRRRRSSRTTMA